MNKPSYNDSVFINCPFDDAYHPLFRAIIYTVYRCGFFPITAMGEDNAMDNRIDKLLRFIEKCKYGIHDISRTELNADHLPRFNMPFELGVFYAARRFGNSVQKGKNGLVLERTKYRYQHYLSDINGVDTKAHENDPVIAIRHTRNWLHTASRRTTIPTANVITNEFNEFLVDLPVIVNALGFANIDEPTFNDYCLIVEEAIRKKLNP